MNHAVQDPLDIDLDSSSKGKSVQALPVLDIRKNRFGDCDPLVIDIPSPLRVYFDGHLFDQIARSGPHGNTQITTLDKVPFDTTHSLSLYFSTSSFPEVTTTGWAARVLT